jgi:hypothetical protein
MVALGMRVAVPVCMRITRVLLVVLAVSSSSARADDDQTAAVASNLSIGFTAAGYVRGPGLSVVAQF